MRIRRQVYNGFFSDIPRAHELVGGEQIGAGELSARGPFRFGESAKIESQRLIAVRREHLREVGPVGLIGGIHVRQDHTGRAATVKMSAQEDTVGGCERYVFAAELLGLAMQTLRRTSSRRDRDNYSCRNRGSIAQ